MHHSKQDLDYMIPKELAKPYSQNINIYFRKKNNKFNLYSNQGGYINLLHKYYRNFICPLGNTLCTMLPAKMAASSTIFPSRISYAVQNIRIHFIRYLGVSIG